MIGKDHRRRDRVVARAPGDEPMHRLADPPVGGVPLGRRAQLDDVHRLAGVQLHIETHPVRHRDRVRGDLGQPGGHDRVVELGRPPEDLRPVGLGARRRDRLGHHGAVVRREPLPLEGEQAVALQVAERAVVTQDVEAVRRPLERAPGPVASVEPLAHVGVEHRPPLLVRHLPGALEQLVVGQRRDRVESRGDDFHLALGIEVRQRDFLARLRRGGVQQSPGHLLRRRARRREIARPGAAALWQVDALEERRYDLAQLGQHQVRVRTYLE